MESALKSRKSTRETAAREKLTYLMRWGWPRFLNGMNARHHKASRMRFLRSVWAWFRWMASPKQPQSIDGLARKSMMVMMVNTMRSMPLAIARALRHTPATRAAPSRVSRSARTEAMMRDAGLRKARWKKLKYSSITRPAPTGSISLRRPATSRTIPRITMHILLNPFITDCLPTS